jgi:ketosteroid isomerase-like protein
MSENLDLVRSIYANWERGDFSSTEWAHPEINYVFLRAGGFAPANAHGRAEMIKAARAYIETWVDLRTAADEYRELDSERVLVFDHLSGRRKRSGPDMQQPAPNSAHLFHVRDGMVRRLVAYEDRDCALADLGLREQAVPGDSATPDLAELVHRVADAASARDLDAVMSFHAPDAVWDAQETGPYEGRAAIRGFLEDFQGIYADYALEVEEVLDLGNGVTFTVLFQRGRLSRTTGWVQMRYAAVGVWANGLLERQMNYLDIDEAHGAAERLAEDRGYAMSQQNVEVVRRAFEAFNGRDIEAALGDAVPEVTLDWSRSRGLDAGVYVGYDAIRQFWTGIFEAFEQLTLVPDEFTVHGEQVMVPNTALMRGRDGIQVEVRSVSVATLRDGRLLRWTIYQDKTEARTAVGIEE